MFKSCSKCGKIHDTSFKCNAGQDILKNREERKLRSKYAWTLKSEEIRERANHLCEVCREEGKISYEDIEVHHIIKVRQDASLLLDNYNLVALCQEHHKQADKGDIDVDYLLELAKKREDGD